MLMFDEFLRCCCIIRIGDEFRPWDGTATSRGSPTTHEVKMSKLVGQARGEAAPEEKSESGSCRAILHDAEEGEKGITAHSRGASKKKHEE